MKTNRLFECSCVEPRQAYSTDVRAFVYNVLTCAVRTYASAYSHESPHSWNTYIWTAQVCTLRVLLARVFDHYCALLSLILCCKRPATVTHETILAFRAKDLLRTVLYVYVLKNGIAFGLFLTQCIPTGCTVHVIQRTIFCSC